MNVSIEQGLQAHFFQPDGTSRPGTEWSVVIDAAHVLVRAYADDTAGLTTADEAAAVIAFVESKLAAGWRPMASAEPLVLPKPPTGGPSLLGHDAARAGEAGKPRYWFPAKHYGWGWGIPATWQGWAVFFGFIAAAVALGILVAPRSLSLYFVSLAVVTGVLIAICYAKGEPPRWRWGE